MTYTVLPNESSETIRTAFKQVRAAVEANGGGFTRNCEVMFDFDKNLRQVYMEEIGNDYGHKLRGCSFHFGQCACNFVNELVLLIHLPKRNQKKKKMYQLVLWSTSWCFWYFCPIFASLKSLCQRSRSALATTSDPVRTF